MPVVGEDGRGEEEEGEEEEGEEEEACSRLWLRFASTHVPRTRIVLGLTLRADRPDLLVVLRLDTSCKISAHRFCPYNERPPRRRDRPSG